MAGLRVMDVTETVKWNAPSFRVAGGDRVDLALHRGARLRADVDTFAFDDTAGLVTWPAPDRGAISIAAGTDLDALVPVILPVIHSRVRSSRRDAGTSRQGVGTTPPTRVRRAYTDRRGMDDGEPMRAWEGGGVRMGDDQPDFVRELWREIRPNALAQADRAVRSAADWSADGSPAAWDSLVEDAHQLAGSLGSFGQADAATLATVLDGLLHTPTPEPDLILESATRLRAALDHT